MRALFSFVPAIRPAPLFAVACLTTLPSEPFIVFQIATTGVTHLCSAAVNFAVRAGAAPAAVAASDTRRSEVTVATSSRIEASVAPSVANRPGG